MALVMVPRAAGIDLVGPWTTLWDTLTSGWSGLAMAMSLLGVALIVIAVLAWAWARRKGGQMNQGSDKIVGAMIIGGTLAAPGMLIPLALRLLQWVVQIAAALLEKVGAFG